MFGQSCRLLSYMANHLHSSFRPAFWLLPLGAVLLAGCLEQVPGLGPDPRTVIRENEAKAIGSACRHAMRGIEDCYTLNPKAPKSMVFAGWKDMDMYMREHKLDGTPSVFTQKPEVEKAPSEEIETEYTRPRS